MAFGTTALRVGAVGTRITSGLLMRTAFTFIEVAISMVVLVVGLTAVLSLLFVGLDWGREIHLRTSVINTARAAIDDPLLVDPAADPIVLGTVTGYVNGLFVVREATEYAEDRWMGAARGGRLLQTFDVTGLPGFYAKIKVEVYEGVLAANIATGNKVYEVSGVYYRAP